MRITAWESGRQMQKTRKSGQTTVHLTAGCSLLSVLAYLGRHNELAKITDQQIVIQYCYLTEVHSHTIDTSQNWRWNQLT